MVAGTAVEPLADHRRIAEGLAERAAHLARRNEALEDSSVLIAHDLKSILLSAVNADEPRELVQRALDLVDSILDAARADQADRTHAPVADCVEQAAADLGGVPAQLMTSASSDFPMPPAALRLVLRNLLGNGVAAGARRIHIRARTFGDRSVLRQRRRPAWDDGPLRHRHPARSCALPPTGREMRRSARAQARPGPRYTRLDPAEHVDGSGVLRAGSSGLRPACWSTGFTSRNST